MQKMKLAFIIIKSMRTIEWFHFLMFQRIKIEFPRDPLTYKSGQSFFVQTALAVTLKKGPQRTLAMSCGGPYFKYKKSAMQKLAEDLQQH